MINNIDLGAQSLCNISSDRLQLHSVEETTNEITIGPVGILFLALPLEVGERKGTLKLSQNSLQSVDQSKRSRTVHMLMSCFCFDQVQVDDSYLYHSHTTERESSSIPGLTTS